MQKIDWDMATVTAGDYTVEFDLEKDDYDKWKKDFYEEIFANNPDKSPALALKEHIIDEICKNMDKYAASVEQLNDGGDEGSGKKKKKDKKKQKQAEDEGAGLRKSATLAKV